MFLTFQKKKHTFELSPFHQHSKFHVSVAWPALVTSIKEVLAVRVCLALRSCSPPKGKSDLKVVSKVQSLVRFLKSTEENIPAQSMCVSESQSILGVYEMAPGCVYRL